MTNANILINNVNPTNSKYGSGMPNLPNNNNWKIAVPYRAPHSFPMTPISPRSDSGTMAYHKYGSTHFTYRCQLVWFGGEGPFRCSISSDHPNAKIGTSTLQTWNRTVNPINANMYDHTRPNDAYEANCVFTDADIGKTFFFNAVVEGQNGQALLFKWQVTVDNSKFMFFSSTLGNDTNPGTFTEPKQTFGYGYATVTNPQNYIYVYKAGTYQVHNGTAGNSAAFNSTHCKSHIGIEPGVTFDMTTGSLTGSGDDITLYNIKLSGGMSTLNDVRQVNFGNGVNRVLFAKCEFDIPFAGTLANDNPAGVFFPNIDPLYHSYIGFVGCTLTPGSVSQMFVFFSVRYGQADGCTALGMNTNAHNGSRAYHLKHGYQNCGIRDSSAGGKTNTGLIGINSQNGPLCKNVEITNCYLNYDNTNTSESTMTLNLQAWGASQAGCEEMHIQRCSGGIYGSFARSPNYAQLTYPPVLNGNAWQYSEASLSAYHINPLTPNKKVTNINMLSTEDVGVIGHVISSTLVL